MTVAVAKVKHRPPLFVETVEASGFDPDVPTPELESALKDPYFAPLPEWVAALEAATLEAAEEQALIIEEPAVIEPQLLLMGLPTTPEGA